MPLLEIRSLGRNFELDRLLRDRGQASWAFLIASNPQGCSLDPLENRNRFIGLGRRLRSAGLATLPARLAGGPRDPWRDRGYLVLGILRRAACMLADEAGQASVLLGHRGEPADCVALQSSARVQRLRDVVCVVRETPVSVTAKARAMAAAAGANGTNGTSRRTAQTSLGQGATASPA